MKYTVDSSLFSKIPHLQFGIVIAKGLKNGPTLPIDALYLERAEDAIRAEIPIDQIKTHPQLAIYRDALQAVGINPNKFTNSVEAMSKRVLKGTNLPRINALVDLCNALALKHRVSLGGHDLKDLSSDLEVRFSQEGDIFLPFGETAYEQVPPGEVVFTSGHVIQTRQWLWRQSELGKVTESSSDIVFQLVGFKENGVSQLSLAMSELSKLLTERFNVAHESYWVDENNYSIEF